MNEIEALRAQMNGLISAIVTLREQNRVYVDEIEAQKICESENARLRELVQQQSAGLGGLIELALVLSRNKLRELEDEDGRT